MTDPKYCRAFVVLDLGFFSSDLSDAQRDEIIAEIETAFHAGGRGDGTSIGPGASVLNGVYIRVHTTEAEHSAESSKFRTNYPLLQREEVGAKPGTCQLPNEGWYCSRDAGHEGPCPTWPIGADKT